MDFQEKWENKNGKTMDYMSDFPNRRLRKLSDVLNELLVFFNYSHHVVILQENW